MKTPTLRKYEEKLIEVNDQLCYFLFAQEEFKNKWEELNKENVEMFTTEMFPKNKFSTRFHVKVKNILNIESNSFHTLLGISLITGVEYLLNYIKDIIFFHNMICNNQQDCLPVAEGLEEVLDNFFTTNKIINLSPEVIKTIKYLRLRRNHVVHIRHTLSDEFNSLIKNNNKLMKKYWNNKNRQVLTNIYDFDFITKKPLEFNIDEIFALINLTRICMRLIDEKILSSITLEQIIMYEIPIYLNENKLHSIDLNVKIRKCKQYIHTKYGYNTEEITDTMLMNTINL